MDKKKKNILTIVIAVIVALAVTLAIMLTLVLLGNNNDDNPPAGPVHVSSVSLSEESYTLKVDATLELVAEVLPNNATDKTCTWSSDNEKVAIVTDGVVTARSVGDATITVTTTDGAKTATCSITVEPTVTDSSSISITVSKNELRPGDTFKVELEVTTSRKDYLWQSLNFAIVPLSADGKKYDKEFAKNFEFVAGSHSTNLPNGVDPDTNLDIVRDLSQDFFSSGRSVGYLVAIELSLSNRPTTESVKISFDVKVKETATVNPSFKLGVAEIASNKIEYARKDKDGTHYFVEDVAIGEVTVTKLENGEEKLVSFDKGVDCFKVTPVEMKIIKDN